MKDLFSADAPNYAAHRPRYPLALAEWISTLAPRHALVWDAGCGSGQFSVPLASVFDRVVASDMSWKQLVYAERKDTVLYRCASAEASALPNGSVDAAVAAQAVHWFDLPSYYDEVKRVARPGAVFALITYNLPSVDAEVDALLHAFYWNVSRPHWDIERRYVETGYRSLPFPFEDVGAPSFSLSARWTLPDLLGYVRTWSGVRALERALGSGPVTTLAEQLARVWSEPEGPREIGWPVSVRATRL